MSPSRAEDPKTSHMTKVKLRSCGWLLGARQGWVANIGHVLSDSQFVAGQLLSPISYIVQINQLFLYAKIVESKAGSQL